jgi:hypothetical protein
MRLLLILSTLSLDIFQIRTIIHPYLNQTKYTIYDEGTNHSYIVYTETNITTEIQHQLPILLYNQPHYVIITHAPIFHKLKYKKEPNKLWSRINKLWLDSCHYVYRHFKN